LKNPSFGLLGTGAFAASCLAAISKQIRPKWVITKSPKRSGRGMKLTPSPVHALALKLDIQVKTTDRISSDREIIEGIKNDLPDLLLVVDFGSMIKEPLLSMAPLKCLNIHPSLLPAYRGSAPVQRAIMDGLKKTGVTLFRLEEGMDSGPILAQKEVAIDAYDDSESLFAKCAEIGAELFLHCMTEVDTEGWQFKVQDHSEATLAPKIEKEETEIDINGCANEICNKVRALSPSPCAYAMTGGKRLQIIKAEPVESKGKKPGILIAKDAGLPVVACGSGAIRLIEVRPEGKKIQRADGWLNGKRFAIGEKIF
jgi:methionyl-tRNA formyltransferase